MAPTVPPFRQPLHPEITDALIEDLVGRFYARVRRDPRLGPIFADAIGPDWGPHLRTMCDFWSSVMCQTGRYKGKPQRAHAALPQVTSPITPDDFALWLALFRDTARALCSPAVAALLIDRAERIAASLMRGLFADPGAAA